MDGQKIPREPHRYSGRTAMHANVNIHEPEQPDDPDTPSGIFDGRISGPSAAVAYSPFLGARLEFGTGVKQVPGRSGGPLTGGDPGERLIEPMQGKKSRLF